MQVDHARSELVGQKRRELGVQRWQDVLGHLDEVDLQSADAEASTASRPMNPAPMTTTLGDGCVAALVALRHPRPPAAPQVAQRTPLLALPDPRMQLCCRLKTSGHLQRKVVAALAMPT